MRPQNIHFIFGQRIDLANPTQKDKDEFVRTFRKQCTGDLDKNEMHRIEKPLREYPELREILNGARSVEEFRKFDSAGRIRPRV